MGLVGEARVLGALPFGEGGWSGFDCFGPLAPPPSSTAGPGDFGEDCLSAKREFRSRPVRRAAQGTRSEAKAVELGRLFFGYLLLAKQKKEPAAGLPRQSNNARSAQTAVCYVMFALFVQVGL